MKYDIIHAGTVREVRSGLVIVGVEAEGACAGCKAQALCGLNGESEKEIAVAETGDYQVGDQVVVGVGTALALKAVLWAYIAPFLLMLGTLLGLKKAGLTELAQGLITLSVAAVWYGVLWALRKRLERDIVFKIGKR